MSSAVADRQRVIYATRKAAGLCVRCEQPSEPGCARCAACRGDDLAMREDIYQRRRAAGLCVVCEKPSPEFTRCFRCRRRSCDRKAARASSAGGAR